jgi:hypothetical protein
LPLIGTAKRTAGGSVAYPNRFFALVCGVAFCALGSAAASPPGTDSRLLSLVPPGAAIVAEVTYGVEPTFLVLTRNNTADLMDLESISGVDPNRTIGRTIFVAARDSRGLVSEHSLLASGNFDTRHIFKSAVENGAGKTEYIGIPVLIVQPLERDKGISHQVRWLAFIDSQLAVFGTITMVQEELGRHLAHSPVDFSLMEKLSRLHSTDQSWCVLTPTVYNQEIVRRTLGALDPGLGQRDPTDRGLILGLHFGRRVEIEYESIPESSNSEEDPPQTQPGFSRASPKAPQLASGFLGTNDTLPHKVIRLSRKQYEEFIAQEETRIQTHGAHESSGHQ